MKLNHIIYCFIAYLIISWVGSKVPYCGDVETTQIEETK